jgi:hypothetical protein
MGFLLSVESASVDGRLVISAESCLDLNKEIVSVASKLKGFDRCPDCECDVDQCACNAIFSCYDVFRYFDKVVSGERCSVRVEVDDLVSTFSCKASHACFLSMCYCLFFSGCEKYGRYGRFLGIYSPYFSPKHLIHMIVTRSALRVVVQNGGREDLFNYILKVNEDLLSRMRIIYGNAVKYHDGELLINMFQMLFGVNYLTSNNVEQMIDEILEGYGLFESVL